VIIDRIAPGLLVAAPELMSAPFRKAVVLLVEHNEEGALGFILNRPATMDLPSVLSEVGIEHEEAKLPKVEVLEGGPVTPGAGWIVFEPTGDEPKDDDRIEVADNLAISSSLDMLKALAQAGSTQRKQLLSLGYSGWGAGQLEEEIRKGSWIPVSLHRHILFDTPLEDRWHQALASAGIDAARLTMRQVADC